MVLRHELCAIAEAAFEADRPVALLPMATGTNRHGLGVAPSDVLVEFPYHLLPAIVKIRRLLVAPPSVRPVSTGREGVSDIARRVFDTDGARESGGPL